MTTFKNKSKLQSHPREASITLFFPILLKYTLHSLEK